MKSNQNNYPGIAKIAMIDCSLLPMNIDLKSLAKIPVAIMTDTIAVNFINTPTCSITKEYVDNGNVYTTTLKFHTKLPIRYTSKIAFIVTAIDGTSSIIGMREPPYPVIKESLTFGEPNGDPKICTYEVTWKSVSAPAITV